MQDLSCFSDSLFRGVGEKINFYLEGKVLGSEVSFDGKYSRALFELSNFAINDCHVNASYGKLSRQDFIWVNNWVVEGGPEKISEIALKYDLRPFIKKGDIISMFVEFPEDSVLLDKECFCIPAENVKKYFISRGSF